MAGIQISGECSDCGLVVPIALSNVFGGTWPHQHCKACFADYMKLSYAQCALYRRVFWEKLSLLHSRAKSVNPSQSHPLCTRCAGDMGFGGLTNQCIPQTSLPYRLCMRCVHQINALNGNREAVTKFIRDVAGKALLLAGSVEGNA